MSATEESHVATDRSANFLAVFRNGSGYDTVRLREFRELGNHIAATDIDGGRHLWSAGADLHIKEVGE